HEVDPRESVTPGRTLTRVRPDRGERDAPLAFADRLLLAARERESQAEKSATASVPRRRGDLLLQRPRRILGVRAGGPDVAPARPSARARRPDALRSRGAA